MPKVDYNDASIDDSEVGANAKISYEVELDEAPLILCPGYSVTILSETADGYCEVETMGGRRGYIPRDALRNVRRLYG